eukprot:Tamp_10644.p1 GENE.Tamp_10644~~Tamp_10644.p1  ORF type:complete len:407 (-),score=71.71 Tamp_10644:509-1729(-)
MQTRAEKATKYTFNPFDEQWHSYDCRVVVEKRPFAEGGMRCCLRMFELEDNGDFMPCVAKIFKKQSMKSVAYFDEALTQMAAECFAQDFNRRQQKFRVSFLPVAVMLLAERQMQLCCVEPMMRGEYIKHNDNDGHVETYEQLPQTFSHFTWEASKHNLVVVDIQGVGDCYTDPQIHSIEGSGFGSGNMGAEGVLKFLKSHKCNRGCEHLQLPSMSRSLAVTQVEKAVQRAKELKSRVQQTPTSPGGMWRPDSGRRDMPGAPQRTASTERGRVQRTGSSERGGAVRRTGSSERSVALQRAGSAARNPHPASREMGSRVQRTGSSEKTSPFESAGAPSAVSGNELQDLQTAIGVSETMLSNMDMSKLSSEQLAQLTSLQNNLAQLQMMRDAACPGNSSPRSPPRYNRL